MTALFSVYVTFEEAGRTLDTPNLALPLPLAVVEVADVVVVAATLGTLLPVLAQDWKLASLSVRGRATTWYNNNKNTKNR